MCGKLLIVRGRGVAANMRPCQGRDRGFEPRRSRSNQKNPRTEDFFILRHFSKTGDIVKYSLYTILYLSLE